MYNNIIIITRTRIPIELIELFLNILIIPI